MLVSLVLLLALIGFSLVVSIIAYSIYEYFKD